MKCDRARDLFSSYLESEMDSGARVAFEQHLSECGRCRAEYDRFNATVSMLDEAPEVELPAGFHESVMAKLERSRRAVPAPVKWWRIDWQHVFTIRVPARAAALGMAVILLMVIMMQMTPMGAVVSNVLGIGGTKAGTQIGDQAPTAPKWSLRDQACKTDLDIRVIAVPSSLDNNYELELRSCSPYPIRYKLQAAGKSYMGSVATNQDSVIRIPSAERGALAVSVSWINHGLRSSQQLFLPAHFDRRAADKRLDLEFKQASVRRILSTLSQKYGIVIVASGNVDAVVPYASVERGNPHTALYESIEMTNPNLRQGTVEDSVLVYTVGPAK